MTSIELTDAQHRALWRVCRHFLEATAWVDRPGSTAQPSLIEERAIAKRVVEGPCDTSSR